MPEISRCLFTVILFIFSVESLKAQIDFPSLITDNMVLQQQTNAAVWGWANPGDTVKVVGSWDNLEIISVAGDSGKWSLDVNTPSAGGPYFITVNSDTINNVLIGEVWVCSGQSNMEFTVANSVNGAEEIAHANYPEIRLFQVPNTTAEFPQDNIDADWKICQPGTINNFSAVGYFFGRKLHLDLNVPVGLISSEWGGTVIEAWTPAEALETSPNLSPPLNKNDHSVLYNAMIHPLISYLIRGAIWYQGESNFIAGDRMNYRNKMDSLITSWRRAWGINNFPFYFVQIAPHNYGISDSKELPEFWEAQTSALSIPNTGMAMTIDIGEWNDIHPQNKQDVGRRLALWALAKTYRQNDLVFEGPLFKSMTLEGKYARLKFDKIGSGLAARDDSVVTGFQVAGPHTPYKDAKVIIDEDDILVSNRLIDKIQAVRYAWNPPFINNLMNNEGLPASPFQVGSEHFTPIPYPEKNSEEFEFKYEANASTPDEENINEGWNKFENAEGDSFNVNNGILNYSTIGTSGSRYFIQIDKNDAWVKNVSDTTSFTIELRARVTESDGENPGIIIWAGTGKKTAYMSIGTNGVYWNGYSNTAEGAKDTLIEGIDNADDFHTFRIAYDYRLWDRFKVWRDGEVIGDSLPQYNIGSGPWLIFGDFDKKTSGTIELDYFRWDASGIYAPGKSTSVNEEKNIIINDFQLYQNYPNPFNPSTTIKFAIPSKDKVALSAVSLRVYDILGKEIATLVNESKQPGIYEIEFNGNRLASGVYFYCLQVGEFNDTKRFILIK